MTAPNELAEVALAFCRECLGWASVELDGLGAFVYEPNDMIIPERHLSFDDLNSVMAAVRSWADRRDCWLDVRVEGHWYAVEVWHGEMIQGTLVAREESSDFRHALLAACVESIPKLPKLKAERSEGA